MECANESTMQRDAELRQSINTNKSLERQNQTNEEELAKHLDEVEAKAARVDELEKKMANLELDKDILRKQMMAEVRLSMA